MIRGSWVESIWIIGCPVIQLMGIPRLSGPVSWNENGSVGPKVPLAHTLKKDIEVNILPVSAQCKTILIPRCWITDYPAGARVIICARSIGNRPINVAVAVPNITRPVEEPP